MNSTKVLSSLFFALFAGVAVSATIYKDATTTDMNTVSNWSTAYNADTPDPASIGAGDTLRFNELFAPTSGSTYSPTISADLAVGAIRADSGNANGGTAFGNVDIGGAYTITLNGNSDYGGSYLSGIVLNSSTGGTLAIASGVLVGASQRWVTSRNLTVSGNVDLGSSTLTFHTAGGTATVSGVISGTGAIMRDFSSSGTAVLSGANTYSGGTTITQGVLIAGNNSAFGTGSVSIGSSGEMGVNGAYTIGNDISITSGSVINSTYAGASTMSPVLSGVISGTGNWTIASNGNTSDTGGSSSASTKLSGANTFTGSVTITAGVVDMTSNWGNAANPIILNGGGLVDKNANVTLSRNIQVGSSGGILRSWGSATTTFSGELSNLTGTGFATLRHTDGGVQRLAGDGTHFMGGFYNARGSLQITANNGNWARTGFTMDNGGGTLTINGGGTVRMKDLTSSGRDVFLNNSTKLDITSGFFSMGTAAWWLQSDAAPAGTLTSSSGALTLAAGYFTGNQVTGDHRIYVGITDSGTTSVSLAKVNQNHVLLGSPNTYSGGTIIHGGRITFAGGGALPSTGNVTINAGGILSASGAYGDVSSWLGSGRIDPTSKGTISITANTTDAIDFSIGGYNDLWMASSGANFTHSGAITPGGNGYRFGAVNDTSTLTVTSALTGSAGLTKRGPGGLTLAEANTYSGGTKINGGTLTLDYGAAGAPASDILLNTGIVTLGGGTLQMTGKASATSSQTLGGVVLAVGTASTISSTIGTGGTNNLMINGIARGSGSAVNFILPASGSITSVGGATSLITDAATGGAYATVDGTNWAARDASSNIIAATYTDFSVGTVTLTDNANLNLPAAGVYTLGASSAPASIRNTVVNGNTLALNGYDLATSGILSSQNLTISGTGNIGPAATGGELVLVQTGNTTTISSTINTAGALTKAGSGTVTLNGANTIGGIVTIASGTLRTGHSNALGNADVIVGAGATLLQINGTNLGGTGSVILKDGANFRQQAANGVGTMSRNFILDSPNVRAQIGGFLYGNGSITTGSISGVGDVLLGNWDTSNGGIFRASNATSGWRVNSYEGQTYVSARGGTIQFNFNGQTPANNVLVTPFGKNTNPAAILYNGTIAFNGIASTSNHWKIDNAIILDATGAYDSASVTVTFNDGIAHFNRDLTVRQAGINSVTMTGQWADKNVVVDGVLGGYGTLRLNSSNQSGVRFVLTNNGNTFNGVLSLERAPGAPYLQLDADNAARSAVVALGHSGARLYVNTPNATIAGLTGVSGSDVASNSATARTLTIENNEDYTHNGTIGTQGSALSLVKRGVGAQTLAGNNTYTGDTEVQAGTLFINGTHTGGGLITVQAGATLGGIGSVGHVAVADDGFLSPGNNDVGHFNVEDLILNGNSIVAVELGAPSSMPDTGTDYVKVLGTLNLDGIFHLAAAPGFGTPVSGDRWLVMSADNGIADMGVTIGTAPVLGAGLSFSLDSTDGQNVFVVVVPEAGTGLLAALGLLLVLRRLLCA